MDNPAPAARADVAGFLADPDLARQASSFGTAASAYARHRPDYPIAAIEWTLEPVAGSARLSAYPVRILDLGAGTGKLTSQLSGLVVDDQPVGLMAVEPDPQMLAEFRRQLPGVAVVAGRAEAIPLPDACVDAVLAGQAAHWFALERAMPEMARVLVPGGVLAFLWNADDDRVDWVAGLHRATGHKTVARVTAFAERMHDDDVSAWLASGQDLVSAPEYAEFEHAQVRTADSLIDTLRTHSMFLVMEPAEREAVLADVRAYLATTSQTAAGEFALPICTFALRAQRL